jgi:WD domain, G-beta repeat
MTTLAAWLSRSLVGCHPRRWRQRYSAEVLDVLDQHRPSARTVLNLAGSALATHLDPAYRMERDTAVQLGRRAFAVAAFVVPIVLVLGLPFGLAMWKDSRWRPDDTAGVTALAFSADQRILVSAAGFDENGTDTVWNVTDPARPKRLAVFEGGAASALSPDGRTVATVSFHDQTVLWNVTSPARAAKIATLPAAPGVAWQDAFSPDGHILATARSGRLYLWDVANPARPRRLRVLAFARAAPDDAWYGFPGDIAFSPDGHTLACAIGHHEVAVWNVTSPAGASRVATLHGQAQAVAALAFSPHGHLLADVSYTGAVIVFDVSDPAHPARVAAVRTVAAAPGTGSTGTQYALAFSPDGHTLTVAADRVPQDAGPLATARETVSRWRLTAAGTVTAGTAFSRDTSPAGYLAFAADGRTLARGAPSGGDRVKLWTLP